MNKQHANLGFFFQRGYFDDLKIDTLGNKNAQKKYFDDKNKELIESSKINILGGLMVDTLTLNLKTVYPGLITGIGMAHVTGMEGEGKLGMAFDFTSGLPYIPGSSVKGLLRSMFPILPPNKPKHKFDKKTIDLLPEKAQYIRDLWNNQIVSRWNKSHTADLKITGLEESEIDELAKIIFEGKHGESYMSIYKRDIFFDAQIRGDYREKGFLDFDYITPHKEALKEPTPIKFLKILPNVEFVFSFKLHDNTLFSEKMIPAAAKLWLFQEMLTTVGIGAKTNVGYGQLKEVK